MKKASESFTLYDFKKIKDKPFIIALASMIGIVLAVAWIYAYNDLRAYTKGEIVISKSQVDISNGEASFPPAGYKVKSNEYRDVSATVELEADFNK